jgi:hypothetical protein
MNRELIDEIVAELEAAERLIRRSFPEFKHPLLTKVREALAQPEKEPVAKKLLEAKQNFERNFGPHAMADWIYSDLLEWLDDTAPQPQRQPLTDEQIDSIVAMSCKKDSSHLDASRVARAIEAAHGIGGQQ